MADKLVVTDIKDRNFIDTGISALSVYTDDMKALHSAFKEAGDIDDNPLYLQAIGLHQW